MAAHTDAGADAELIAEAARLQEVGKLYAPVELLGRVPETLEPGQRLELEVHYERGRALALGAGLPERLCAWILHARERWDGHGPGGLAREEIPLASRVLAVTREYVDAPLSPAAAGLDPRTAALQRLSALAGTVLDPSLAALGAGLAAEPGD